MTEVSLGVVLAAVVALLNMTSYAFGRHVERKDAKDHKRCYDHTEYGDITTQESKR